MKLRVNDETRDFRAEKDTPLLWVLRDHLNMTGTKFGCGKGLCGACTVHVNGQPVRSCSIPVSAVLESEITPIEGIGSADNLHPVQQAWQDVDVPQCGYCQSGQIMSAVGLLAENPKPSVEEIHDYMDGNACRCATYQRIRAGIQRASEILEG